LKVSLIVSFLVDRQVQFAASVRQRTSDRTGEKAWYHKYRSPDSNSARQHGISALQAMRDLTPPQLSPQARAALYHIFLLNFLNGFCGPNGWR